MEFELYTKIIDELDQLGIKSVWLQVLGEPLIHKDIIRMVRYAKEKRGIGRLGFSTNCNFLTPEISRELIESRVDRLIFAIDAATESTYNLIRVGGNYHETVKNIETFFQIRKKLNISEPSVRLQFIVMQQNKNEIDDFRDYWQNKIGERDQIAFKPCDNWAATVENFILLEQKQMNVSFEAWKSRMGEINGRNKKVSITYRTPCHGFLFTGGSILSNGDFTVCGLDIEGEMKLGNISENSIHELWNGRIIHHIREKHMSNKVDEFNLCKNCSRTYRSLSI